MRLPVTIQVACQFRKTANSCAGGAAGVVDCANGSGEFPNEPRVSGYFAPDGLEALQTALKTIAKTDSGSTFAHSSGVDDLETSFPPAP